MIQPEYESIQYVRNGLVSAKKNGKWGIIDLNGKVVIDFQYAYLFSFNDNGLAAVCLDREFGFDKYGCINTKGEIVVPIEQKEVYTYSDGYIVYIYVPENKPESFSEMRIIRTTDGSTVFDSAEYKQNYSSKG